MEKQEEKTVEYQGINLRWRYDGVWTDGDTENFIALSKVDGEVYEGTDPLNEAVVLELDTNEIIVNDMFDWEREVSIQTLREFSKTDKETIITGLKKCGVEYTVNRVILKCKIKDLGVVIDNITDTLTDGLTDEC